MTVDGERRRRSEAPTWTVAVIGAGSWGTALAVHAAESGHPVYLWGRDVERVCRIRDERENATYLPGITLPSGLIVSDRLGEALQGADLAISAVPSRFLRDVWQEAGRHLPAGAHLVSATKGIEPGSGLRMTEVLLECLPGPPASMSSLSGPSFALELARGAPTAVALGCEDPDAATAVQEALSAGPLRVYRNADLVGVELGGALKNVIAIAAGIVDGLGFGTNPRAALICRGLKEISALAAAMGARPETLMGLSGLGDLVLTCTGPLSRNRQVGEEIGRGRRFEEVMEGMTMVAEGAVTVRSALDLAARVDVEMPIAAEVFEILYRGKAPGVAIEALMARTLVEE